MPFILFKNDSVKKFYAQTNLLGIRMFSKYEHLSLARELYQYKFKNRTRAWRLAVSVTVSVSIGTYTYHQRVTVELPDGTTLLIL